MENKYRCYWQGMPSSPPRLLWQQLLEGGHLHTGLLIGLDSHLLPHLARLAVKVLADLAPAYGQGTLQKLMIWLAKTHF